MKKCFLTFGLFCLFGIGISHGSGIIIPEPSKPGDLYPHALSVESHAVDIIIDNQVSNTRVDQIFVNHYERDVEGTYIFPIPEDASVSRFTMWVGKEELQGEILDKNEAKEIYEGIVRNMQDPAILEFVGRGAFRARIFPIPAHGEKRVSLDYEEILQMENGVCEFRYPLGTRRFTNGNEGNFEMTITLTSKSPIKSVYSPTHDIDIKRKGDHRVEIEYVDTENSSTDDFLLYYTVSKEDFGFNLLTYREKEGKGFFLGMISPSVLLSDKQIIGKDLMFVLDHSGSMNGEKIEQAKSALLFSLNSLNPKDRFNLITFSDEISVLNNGLAPATPENIKDARKFVKGIEANGGTNIHSALLTAMKQLRDTKRTNYIIFLTDGLPTVGETNIYNILDDINSDIRESSRIFAFGVGYDVNTQFLDRLSTENLGISEYVRPEEDIEVKVSKFYSKIANPVLTDLQLDFGKINVTQIYPKVLPDLFHGSQLIILGRYEGRGKTRIKLTGMADDEKRNFSYTGYFSGRDEKKDFIPRLWASRKIGFLIEEIRSHGQNRELVDEIVRLSKKYGIMTEYTSFLVEEDKVVAMDESQSRASEIMKEAEKSVTGGWAVNQSANARALQKSAQVPRAAFFDARGKEKKIGGVVTRRDRAFFNKKGNWVDTDYSKDRKVIDVRRFSRAYFQLMERDDTLGEYLSLGDRVLVNVGDIAIQIEDDGKEEFTDTELNRIFQ
jgi:Ca-activated chloride channel family protein